MSRAGVRELLVALLRGRGSCVLSSVAEAACADSSSRRLSSASVSAMAALHPVTEVTNAGSSSQLSLHTLPLDSGLRYRAPHPRTKYDQCRSNVVANAMATWNLHCVHSEGLPVRLPMSWQRFGQRC